MEVREESEAQQRPIHSDNVSFHKKPCNTLGGVGTGAVLHRRPDAHTSDTYVGVDERVINIKTTPSRAAHKT